VNDELLLSVPEELVEAIAQRAAAIVLAQLPRSDHKRWLTCQEAGERLGCSAAAVRMRHRRGRLRGKHQGSRLYISAASVGELK
jgi:hypothetical protein